MGTATAARPLPQAWQRLLQPLAGAAIVRAAAVKDMAVA